MFILRLLDLRAPSSHFLIMIYDLPKVRGVLTAQKDLSSLTWLRVGGPADWLFQPADTEDLSFFLKNLDPQIPVFPMGVGSNVIVRDGGLKAVVVRLSPRTFGQIEVNELEVTAGAGALDSRIAITAAAAGIDLTFFRTIPGSVGGALRMNAGCYGSYTADVFVSAQVVLRNGTITTLCANDLYFSYRNSRMPKGAVITSVTLRGGSADPRYTKEVQIHLTMAWTLCQHCPRCFTTRCQRLLSSHFAVMLAPSCGIFGGLGDYLGPSWGYVGSCRGYVGVILGPLGASSSTFSSNIRNTDLIEMLISFSLCPRLARTQLQKTSMSFGIELTHFFEMHKSLSLTPSQPKTHEP